MDPRGGLSLPIDGPELCKLRLFCAVAELGTLTRAAAALDSDASAISRQIGALERRWGSRLFHRTGRGLELTEFGARLLPEAQALLLQAQALDRRARDSRVLLTGDVRLAVQPSLSRRLVPGLLKALRERHPAIGLAVYEGSSGQLQEWHRSGYVDIAATYRYDVRETGQLPPPGVTDAFLVGRAGDPLFDGGPIAFKRLGQLPMILGTAPNALLAAVQQAARRQSVLLDVVLEANTVHLQLDAVSEGFGYAVTAGDLVPSLRERSLASARIVQPAIECRIALAVTSERPASRAVREVARTLQEIAEACGREVP